ncbi:hypothetical protein ACT17R_08730 [Sphingopyxis sp. Q841]
MMISKDIAAQRKGGWRLRRFHFAARGASFLADIVLDTLPFAFRATVHV